MVLCVLNKPSAGVAFDAVTPGGGENTKPNFVDELEADCPPSSGYISHVKG